MMEGDDMDDFMEPHDEDAPPPDDPRWTVVPSLPPPGPLRKEHWGMFGLLPDDPAARRQELASIAADREACPSDPNDCGLCAVRSSVLLEAQADGIYDPFEVTLT